MKQLPGILGNQTYKGMDDTYRGIDVEKGLMS